MIDEKLDPDTHDLAFEGYDEQIVSDKNQVAQAVKMAVLYVGGELFDNTTVGIDYLNTVFAKGADQAKIDALIKATIMAVPEVTNIISYVSTFDKGNRAITVSCKFDTIYGQVYLQQIGLIS